MNCNYRRAHIIGNWKTSKTPLQTIEYIKTLKSLMPRTKNYEVGLCVPPVSICDARRTSREVRIHVGVENCQLNEEAAYTGELPAEMLSGVGVKYVLLGHSERRALGETDKNINFKVKAVLNADMRPVICVGEAENHRENDVAFEWVALQVKLALAGIPAALMGRVIFVYEPICDKGVEAVVTPERAAEMCAWIRKVIRQKYKIDGGGVISRKVSILYGGYITEENAEEFLSQADIDGALVGTTSLDVNKFSKIIETASRLNKLSATE